MKSALPNSSPPSWTSALHRFVATSPAVERCELCSAELAEEHDHLVEPATRKLLCACGSCAVLFGYNANGKFRRVPRRIELLENSGLTEPAWNCLGIPISLAFFVRSSAEQRVIAMYPSPGGPTEATIDGDAWAELAEECPALADLDEDVEALLINRVNGARQAYRVPIDECYKLVGLIRSHWRGFSGGTEVWKHIDQFFASLRERAAKKKGWPLEKVP